MVTSLESSVSQASYSSTPVSQGVAGEAVGDASKTTAAKVATNPSVTPKESSVTESSVSKVVSQFVALQTEKDANNETAKAVHQIDNVRVAIDQMRENLARIVKMYPPYAKDDPARAQLMQSVIGLRQVTEQLTVPPAYNQLLNDATALPGVQDINASDSQVADALASLDAVSDTFAMESKKLFDSAVPSSGVAGEQAAGQQSQKVGSSLGALPAGISSGAGRDLMQSLVVG